jgi:predicted metalloendopeptidase
MDSNPFGLFFDCAGCSAGHEMTHGFDSQGRLYSPQGTLKDWWTPKTETEFVSRSQCFINQYAAFHITDPAGKKVPINSKFTLGENLADNGGFKESFTAWTELTESKTLQSAPLLPGFEKYSPTQLFFIAHAYSACSKAPPQMIIDMMNTDPHSPWNVRVNAVLQNMEAFSEAFQCKPGTPMHSPKRCSIWG